MNLTPAEKRRFGIRAKANGRSLSEELRWLVARGLEHEHTPLDSHADPLTQRVLAIMRENGVSRQTAAALARKEFESGL